MPTGKPVRQAGFTLLAALFMVAALGVGLAALGTLWQAASQHEKEAQLLFVGDQYRRAIASYYQATPGVVKQYPAALTDLLRDPRFPHTVRHLRRLYPDPVTGNATWGLVKAEGEAAGIIGVHSLSAGEPRKRANFSSADHAFEAAATYADWVFTAQPQNRAPAR